MNYYVSYFTHVFTLKEILITSQTDVIEFIATSSIDSSDSKTCRLRVSFGVNIEHTNEDHNQCSSRPVSDGSSRLLLRSSFHFASHLLNSPFIRGLVQLLFTRCVIATHLATAILSYDERGVAFIYSENSQENLAASTLCHKIIIRCRTFWVIPSGITNVPEPYLIRLSQQPLCQKCRLKLHRVPFA